MGKTVASFSMDIYLKEQLEEYSKKVDLGKSAILGIALGEYFDKHFIDLPNWKNPDNNLAVPIAQEMSRSYKNRLAIATQEAEELTADILASDEELRKLGEEKFESDRHKIYREREKAVRKEIRALNIKDKTTLRKAIEKILLETTFIPDDQNQWINNEITYIEIMGTTSKPTNPDEEDENEEA